MEEVHRLLKQPAPKSLSFYFWISIQNIKFGQNNKQTDQIELIHRKGNCIPVKRQKQRYDIKELKSVTMHMCTTTTLSGLKLNQIPSNTIHTGY